MNHGVETLLVEDNANDEMLALRTFNRQNVADNVYVARNGAEALEHQSE